MSSATESGSSDRLELSPECTSEIEERIAEVERGDVVLVPGEEPTHADIEQAWADEAVRRLERETTGETSAISWDEAKRRVKVRYGFE